MSSLVLATAGYDQAIKFWEATTGICWRTIKHEESQVNKLEISQDKQLLAAAGNPSIRIYDIQSAASNPLSVLEAHQSNVSAIGFHKERRWLFSGSEDKKVRVWDLRTRESQRDFESRGPVNTVELHPARNELISGDQDGSIRVWDMTAGKCSCELLPEADVPIRSLSIASDGTQVVAANDDGACFLWSVQHASVSSNHSAQFEPLHRLQAHNGYILKCLISPDVRKLATASCDKTVKIWNLDTYQNEQTLTGHTKWVWDAVFSVDAAYLVTASSDHTARLWDVERGQDIRRYTGHQKAVVCCALNDNAIDGSHP